MKNVSKRLIGGLLTLALVGSYLPVLTANAATYEITCMVQFKLDPNDNGGAVFGGPDVQGPNHPDVAMAMKETMCEGWFFRKEGANPAIIPVKRAAFDSDTNKISMVGEYTFDTELSSLQGYSLVRLGSDVEASKSFVMHPKVRNWGLNWYSLALCNASNDLVYQINEARYPLLKPTINFKVYDGYTSGDITSDKVGDSLSARNDIKIEDITSSFNASFMYKMPSPTIVLLKTTTPATSSGNTLTGAEFTQTPGETDWSIPSQQLVIDTPFDQIIPSTTGEWYRLKSMDKYSVAQMSSSITMYLVPAYAQAPTRLKINTDVIGVQKGETTQLGVMPIPNDTNGGVTWTSNNPSAATVDERGLVTAVGRVGESATITATSVLNPKVNATCRIDIILGFGGIDGDIQVKGYESSGIDPNGLWAIDVYFKDEAVYVYDAGQTINHDKETAGSTLGGDIANQFDAEIWSKVQDGISLSDKNKVGHWYGFDGTQNMVTSVNRTGIDVGMRAATTNYVDYTNVNLYVGDKMAITGEEPKFVKNDFVPGESDPAAFAVAMAKDTAKTYRTSHPFTGIDGLPRVSETTIDNQYTLNGDGKILTYDGYLGYLGGSDKCIKLAKDADSGNAYDFAVLFYDITSIRDPEGEVENYKSKEDRGPSRISVITLTFVKTGV